MSGHADTIRRVLEWPIGFYDAAENEAAYRAMDEMVMELREQAETIATLANASQRWQETVQRQADRIAWLEGEVAGWRIKLAECEERHG